MRSVNAGNRFLPPVKVSEDSENREMRSFGAVASEILPGTTLPDAASPVADGKIGNNSQVLYLASENYFREYNRIYDSINDYTGTVIETEGYIYRENEFEKNLFVLAQNLMWCCAADIAIVGFYCESEKAENFETDSWYRVRGVIEKAVYFNPSAGQESEYPVIIVNEYRKIEEPDFPVVFPY